MIITVDWLRSMGACRAAIGFVERNDLDGIDSSRLSGDFCGWLEWLEDSGRRPTGRRAWTYEYDSRGDLVSQTSPSGLTTTFVYDDHGGMLSATSPYGVREFSYVYDDHGNLASQACSNGCVRAFDYERDSLGRVVRVLEDGMEALRISRPKKVVELDIRHDKAPPYYCIALLPELVVGVDEYGDPLILAYIGAGQENSHGCGRCWPMADGRAWNVRSALTPRGVSWSYATSKMPPYYAKEDIGRRLVVDLKEMLGADVELRHRQGKLTRTLRRKLLDQHAVLKDAGKGSAGSYTEWAAYVPKGVDRIDWLRMPQRDGAKNMCKGAEQLRKLVSMACPDLA